LIPKKSGATIKAKENSAGHVNQQTTKMYLSYNCNNALQNAQNAIMDAETTTNTILTQKTENNKNLQRILTQKSPNNNELKTIGEVHTTQIDPRFFFSTCQRGQSPQAIKTG
jgi:hypothetical protein